MSRIVTAIRTVGVSKKAILAFLFPIIGTVVGAAIDWLSSGQFDVTTIRTAAAGALASALALLGAYLGKPGNVEVPADPMVPGTGQVHGP